MAHLFQNDTSLTNFDQRQPSGLDAASFLSRQTTRIVNSHLETANRIIVSQDRIASGIDEINFGIDRLSDGLESLASAFDWGFSELVWQIEQQRKELTNILKVLEAPLDTQAKELKKRAEDAYKNKWIDDALEDFLESEKKNRYDFTVHQYLGNIYFFEKKAPEIALKYYEKAAKYAEPKSLYYTSYALIHIALIYYLEKDFKKAYDATSKAIELSPDFYEAHYQHAKYCANLNKYDEAIEHLDKAQIGDRYYCVKADSEKDFQVMKKQLLSFFESLRVIAQKEAEIELNQAQELVQSAGAQDSDEYAPDSFELAKNKLKEAKTFFGRKSYFDYLDAEWKAKESQKDALVSSIKSLSTQINETNKVYGKESYDDQRMKKSIDEWNIWISLAVLIFFGAVSFWIGLIIGVIVFFFIKGYTGSSFKNKREYENTLSVLNNNLSKNQVRLNQLNKA
ncbi:MAG: CDC27 family protein [Candidatus Methanoperedens sp.]|nr:CDC27 family protein [Candidatus Methanoperedens sp.]